MTLARKAFTVPASGVVRLRAKLARTNLRLLRKSRRIKAKLTVTLTNAAGHSSTATKTVTLRR